MSPAEAYAHLKVVLEQCNAITGTMFSEKSLEQDRRKYDDISKNDNNNENLGDVDWHLEIEDDSLLYFSPELGNVIFASAIDGWAFR